MTITAENPTQTATENLTPAEIKELIATASEQFQIQIYTKPDCVKCEHTYRWLDRKGIKFADPIDVTVDPEAMSMLVSLGVRGMPYVSVSGPGYQDSWNDLKMSNLEALYAAVKDVAGL